MGMDIWFGESNDVPKYRINSMYLKDKDVGNKIQTKIPRTVKVNLTEEETG